MSLPGDVPVDVKDVENDYGVTTRAAVNAGKEVPWEDEALDDDRE